MQIDRDEIRRLLDEGEAAPDGFRRWLNQEIRRRLEPLSERDPTKFALSAAAASWKDRLEAILTEWEAEHA